jgi:hypothetical protein
LVHGGITAITGFNTSIVNASYDIEVAMRRPNGTYTAYQTCNTTNLQSQFSSLTGYDSDEGLQVKWRITKTATGLTQYIRNFHIVCTVDANYRYPYNPNPTIITFTGVVAGSNIALIS